MQWFTNQGQLPLDTPTRLMCGALAGITSVCKCRKPLCFSKKAKSISYIQSGSTYPLDLVRSRLSIVTATIGLPAAPQPSLQQSGQQPSLSSAYHTSSTPAPAMAREQLARQKMSMWGMTLKVMREEGGFRALYRGLPATAFGVAPYVGINFAAYEALRGVITPPGKTSVARKLTCGALAGA